MQNEQKESKKQNSKQNNNQDMPNEKFLRFGAEGLTESELLAIILRTGTKDSSALQLAQHVLSLAKYPREGLLGLYDISLEEKNHEIEFSMDFSMKDYESSVTMTCQGNYKYQLTDETPAIKPDANSKTEDLVAFFQAAGIW